MPCGVHGRNGSAPLCDELRRDELESVAKASAPGQECLHLGSCVTPCGAHGDSLADADESGKALPVKDVNGISIDQAKEIGGEGAG
jgi:hypothetical protein